MDIRQLRYFESIARLGSLTKAARALGIAQPALSRQVALIERELGVRLLTRTRRGVALTAAGSIFAARALELIEKLDKTVHEMQSYAGELLGQVALGFYGGPTLAQRYIVPLISEFHALHPKVTISLQDGTAAVIADLLVGGSLDIAILPSPPENRGFDAIELRDDDLLLVSAPDPGVRNPQSCALADLAALPLIIPGRESSLRRHLDAVTAELGIELRVDLTVNSVTLIKELVKRGSGYGVLPRMAVQEEIEDGSLAGVRIDDTRLVAKVVCVTASSRQLSPAAELLRNQIVTQWQQVAVGDLDDTAAPSP